MKKKAGYSLLLLLCVILGLSCSTGRNTSSSRAYHELKTRYNIYYNAQKLYNELMKEQLATISDNRFEMLPFYPSSSVKERNHTGGPFDIVIHKTEKAISEHSISSKPRRNPSKAYSVNYRKWLSQEEFNPFMSKVWLLMGKAHIQNGDYDMALSVFSEILKIFPDDIDITSEAQIWMLRTYTEMNRLYDAQNLIYLLKTRRLPSGMDKLFNESYAHYLIESNQFKEAIPFITNVIVGEKNLMRKKWLQFLLAQVYTITKDYKNAFKYFEEMKGLNTPKELLINASAFQQVLSDGEQKADSIALLLSLDRINEEINTITTTETSTTGVNSQNRYNDLFQSSFQSYWEANIKRNTTKPIRVSYSNQEVNRKFEVDAFSQHLLILLQSDQSVRINELLYSIANFNFSNFKLRTFNITPIRLNKKNAIKLEPFSSLEDVLKYLQVLRSDTVFRSDITGINTPVIISSDNFNTLQNNTLDEYKKFYEEYIDNVPKDLTPSEIWRHVDRSVQAETKADSIFKVESLSLEPEHITENGTNHLEPTAAKSIDVKITEIKNTEIRTTDAKINNLKSSLEQKAAIMIERSVESSSVNDRTEQLKKREQLREEKIKQRDKDLKERERKRKIEIRQREKERELKIRAQKR